MFDRKTERITLRRLPEESIPDMPFCVRQDRYGYRSRWFVWSYDRDFPAQSGDYVSAYRVRLHNYAGFYAV